MDREEPTLNRSDMRDVQFRSPRRSETAHEAGSYSLWWQIALGVFVAMLAHSIVVGLYRRMEMKAGIEAFTEEMRKATREMPATRPIRDDFIEPRNEPRPLSENERCVNGRRFRRISNGWQQLPYEPCN